MSYCSNPPFVFLYAVKINVDLLAVSISGQVFGNLGTLYKTFDICINEFTRSLLLKSPVYCIWSKFPSPQLLSPPPYIRYLRVVFMTTRFKYQKKKREKSELELM